MRPHPPPLIWCLVVLSKKGPAAGPAAAPPHPSSPRRTIAVVGSGRMGASAPRHPLPADRETCVVFDRAVIGDSGGFVKSLGEDGRPGGVGKVEGFRDVRAGAIEPRFRPQFHAVLARHHDDPGPGIAFLGVAQHLKA